MNRIAMTVCLAVALACGASAGVYDIENFNAPNLNLLECWNPDGTYGINMTVSYFTYDVNNVLTGEERYRYANGVWSQTNYDAIGSSSGPWVLGGTPTPGGVNPNNLVNYGSWENGAARYGHGGLGDNRMISVTYTFDAPVKIGALASFWWSEGDHNATNYTWKSGDTILAAVFPPANPFDTVNFVRLPKGVQMDVFQTPVVTQTLTFEMYLEGRNDNGAALNAYHLALVGGLAAYLAPNEKPDMSKGTYNIFYAEGKNLTPTLEWADPEKAADHATYGLPNPNWAAWTDHRMGSNGGKPSSEAANATWTFSQEYELYGMILPQYSSGRYLADAMLEALTEDGWVEIWKSEGNRYVDNNGNPSDDYYDRDQAYIGFDFVVASAVRLSWGDNPEIQGVQPGTVEITEFQLFGRAVPEPATMALLALGGAALLRRRRQGK